MSNPKRTTGGTVVRGDVPIWIPPMAIAEPGELVQSNSTGNIYTVVKVRGNDFLVRGKSGRVFLVGRHHVDTVVYIGDELDFTNGTPVRRPIFGPA